MFDPMAVQCAHVSCCRMNALKLAAIFLVVCVALAPLIDALEAEDEEVVCHKLNSEHFVHALESISIVTNQAATDRLLQLLMCMAV